MKTNILKVLTIGILLVSQSCSLPETERPKFQKDSKEVIDELKSLRDFEEAEIKSRAQSFDDSTSNILILELLNGKDVADNETELRDLGIQALKIVNNSIENESDYDQFQVVFIQKSNIGPLNTSFTRPIDYTLEELK